MCRGEAAFRLHFLICTCEAVIGGRLIGCIVYARSRFSASMLGFSGSGYPTIEFVACWVGANSLFRLVDVCGIERQFRSGCVLS